MNLIWVCTLIFPNFFPALGLAFSLSSSCSFSYSSSSSSPFLPFPACQEALLKASPAPPSALYSRRRLKDATQGSAAEAGPPRRRVKPLFEI